MDQVGLRRLQLAVGLVRGAARLRGGVARRLELALALLCRGDVGPDRDGAALAGAELPDVDPAPACHARLAAPAVAVDGKPRRDPVLRAAALRGVDLAAAVDRAQDVLEMRADHE